MEKGFCITSEKINPVCFANNPNLAMAVMVDILSDAPRFSCINAGFTNMTGYAPADVEKELNENVWMLLKKSDRDFLKHTYRIKYAKNTGYQCSYQLLTTEGEALYVMDSGYFFENEKGQPCAQMILTDITKIRNSNEEASKCRERLELGIKSANSCVFEVDLVRRIHTYFKNAAGLFGVSDEKILEDVRGFARLDSDDFRVAVSEYFAHPDDQAIVEDAFEHVLNGQAAAYEARMKVVGGRYVWCRVNVTPVLEDGVPARMIGIITNINQMKARADKYKRKAARDLYTGLYNKQHSELLIRSVLTGTKGKHHALVLIDIDNLKSLNDTYGHAAGDEAIKDASQQLKRIFRRSDIVGRYGGDEFIVLIRDICGISGVETRMRELLQTSSSIPVTKSVGIAVFPRDGEDFESLLSCADAALYQAKKKKNVYIFYEKVE